jgi:hypothetical protein
VLLSFFEQQQIHAAYKEAQTQHTTQCLHSITKHVTIAQQTTQFDVLNHKDKQMVGNELLSFTYPSTAQHKHSSCEAKDTHQMLHLLLHAVTECRDV